MKKTSLILSLVVLGLCLVNTSCTNEEVKPNVDGGVAVVKDKV